MFQSSEGTDKLDAALAKAQGRMKPALKQSENSHFRSKYADLAAVWDAAREAIESAAICVTQWPIKSDDGCFTILTRVSHAGQFYQSTFSVPVAKQDPQGYASAATYTRRITLSAALGVAPDDDDDGNAASQISDKPKPRAKPKMDDDAPKPVVVIPNPVSAVHASLGPSPSDVTAVQRSALVGRIQLRGWTNAQTLEHLKNRYNKSTILQLTKTEYDEMYRELEPREPGEDREDDVPMFGGPTHGK